MSVDQWILGVLFRPASTFDKARKEMRLSYWWILLAVLTLECVMALYDPTTARNPDADTTSVVLSVMSQGLFWFYVTSGLLFLAARLFRWALTWFDALKYAGLAWAVILAEDIATFYWSLRDNYHMLLWLSLPFLVWYMVSLAAGIRRVTGFSGVKAATVALIASAPWRLLLFWLLWRQSRP